jgi:tRNA A-37 threonylcarbamoyl transferase component Bud32
MLGVATPHPYLFYEERIFRVFRRRAFFLSKNLDAPTLLEQIQSKREQSFPIERLVLAFKYLFDTMCTYRISHGDMKASNFIFDGDRLYVLDLDAMKRHVNEEVFLRAIKKDLTRFMKNWQGTVFESKFKKLIDDIELNP